METKTKILLIPGFNLSTDYALLWDLVQENYRIPAWVLYTDEYEPPIWDIVEVKKAWKSDHYSIGTRGRGYEGFKGDKQEFLETCMHYCLHYIKPPIIPTTFGDRWKWDLYYIVSIGYTTSEDQFLMVWAESGKGFAYEKNPPGTFVKLLSIHNNGTNMPVSTGILNPLFVKAPNDIHTWRVPNTKEVWDIIGVEMINDRLVRKQLQTPNQ